MHISLAMWTVWLVHEGVRNWRASPQSPQKPVQSMETHHANSRQSFVSLSPIPLIGTVLVHHSLKYEMNHSKRLWLGTRVVYMKCIHEVQIQTPVHTMILMYFWVPLVFTMMSNLYFSSDAHFTTCSVEHWKCDARYTFLAILLWRFSQVNCRPIYSTLQCN